VKLQLSLSAKVLILVVFPLLLQVGLLFKLASLQKEAEADLRVAEEARKFAELGDNFSNLVYEMVAAYNGETAFERLHETNFDAMKKLDEAHRLHAELVKLSKDDKELNESIVRAGASLEEAMQLATVLRTSYERAGKAEYEYRKPLWKKLHYIIFGVLNDKLSATTAGRKRAAEKSVEKQAALRQEALNLMIAGGVLDTLLTVLVAIYLTRNITGRLSNLKDNTIRLTLDQPLLPRSGGSDEIAHLDGFFHAMACELKESARKERALVDNARELIFSLDANGVVTKLNPACLRVLGGTADEMLGIQFISLVSEEDNERALDFMSALRNGQVQEPLELRIRCWDRRVIDALWSAQWSKEEKTFFCILQDISERRAVERMKEEVMAMITHDLRTPLMTISNILSMLDMSEDEKDLARTHQYVSMAKRNTDRMMLLITDLLDLEKARAGMLQIKHEPVPVSSLFQAAEDALKGSAEEQKVELVFVPSPIVVNGDQELLQRVVINLGGNALKFTGRGSAVTLKAAELDGFACISVEDEGPGIAPEELPTIFDRFQQAKSAGKSKVKGSGLGLAICKSVVELHGGCIEVDSTLDKGSTFSFTVPVWKA